MLNSGVHAPSLSALKMTESSKVGVTLGSGKTLPTPLRPSRHSTYRVIAAPRSPHGSSAEAASTSWPTLEVRWRGSSSSWQRREEALAAARQSSICRVTSSWRSRSSSSKSTSTKQKSLPRDAPALFTGVTLCIGGWSGSPAPSWSRSPAPSWSQSRIDFIRNIRPVFFYTGRDSMIPPTRTEAPHVPTHRNDNILTRRAGVSLVATFHTAPPVRHLGEVFSDHLDHRTWFLLGSLYGFEVKTLARHHPESCMWRSALSSRSVHCVFSMDSVRRPATAERSFYTLSWSCACVGGANRFLRESSWFAAHATRAGVAARGSPVARAWFITAHKQL